MQQVVSLEYLRLIHGSVNSDNIWTRFLGGGDLYVGVTYRQIYTVNHTCHYLPSHSWYSFTDPGGMKGWVWVGKRMHDNRIISSIYQKNCYWKVLQQNQQEIHIHTEQGVLLTSLLTLTAAKHNTQNSTKSAQKQPVDYTYTTANKHWLTACLGDTTANG